MKDFIACPCCHGKGAIPLPAEYKQTLKLMKSFKRPVTTSDLQTDGSTHGAVAMRLSRLELWRFVRRVAKQGKWWTWEPI